MKVQLMMIEDQYEGIHYTQIEMPTVSVGWEIYVKFPTLPKAIHVKVKRVTFIGYKDSVTIARGIMKDNHSFDVNCNVTRVE